MLEVWKQRAKATQAVAQQEPFEWREADRRIRELQGVLSGYLWRIESHLELARHDVFRCAGWSGRTSFHLIQRLAHRTAIAFAVLRMHKSCNTTEKSKSKKLDDHLANIQPISEDDLNAILEQLRLDTRRAARFVTARLRLVGDPWGDIAQIHEFILQLVSSGAPRLHEHEINWLSDYLKTTNPEECIDGPHVYDRLQAILLENGGALVVHHYLELELDSTRRVIRRRGYAEEVGFGRKQQPWRLVATLVTARDVGRTVTELMKELDMEAKNQTNLYKTKDKANELIGRVNVAIDPDGKGRWMIVDANDMF